MKIVYQYDIGELDKSRAFKRKDQRGLSILHDLVMSGKSISLYGSDQLSSGVVYQLDNNGNHSKFGTNFEMHLTVVF